MKYEITDEVKVIFGRTLHRIKAIKSFASVSKGELGGWVENADNLSQEGNSWITENGMVFGNARVFGDSQIWGNAIVFDYAQICDNVSVFGNARIYGNAKVFGNARIYGNAKVFDYAQIWDTASVTGNAQTCGNAIVFDDALICGHARISGNARVDGRARVFGNACVADNARVTGNATVAGDGYLRRPNDIIVVGPVGSRRDFTTFYKKSSGNEILVTCGCFTGTIEEFEHQVEITHGNNGYAKVYKKAIELAKLQLIENND